MSSTNQLIIYYFSGTGNAKHVSTWVSEVAQIKQIPTQLIDISKINRKHIPTPPAEALIGFCSPTHGFNYPPVMMHFIFRFPKSSRNKVFLMNTRAGMKLYKWFIPGLSGVALILSALVILLKGYKIVGMRSIDLPSNWISLHPGLRKKDIESLFIRCKKATCYFADRILEGKKNFRALYELPIDLALAPIAFFYYFFGRFMFAKSFYASRLCNNCGICIKQCPVNAIRLVDNRPFWSYRCESCMHCMNSCPQTAIETAHGFIVGVMIFANTIVQSFVYIWLLNHNISWFSASAKYGSGYRFIFETLIAFFALIVSYWLVHYLRKIKVVEMLIKYTSLTIYKFWGRY
jgi:ferredoxin